MTKKPIVRLHAGTHKSGSTSIQSALTAAADHLPEDGFYYSRTRDIQHSYIAISLHNGNIDQFNMFMDEIIREWSEFPGTDLIISGEEFYTLPIESMRVFRSYLSDFDVSVVIYFRNYYKWLISQFKYQLIFSDDCIGWRGLDGIPPIYPDIVIENLTAVFGFDMVSVRCTEAVPDVVEDFSKQLGIKRLSDQGGRLNRSIDTYIGLLLDRATGTLAPEEKARIAEIFETFPQLSDYGIFDNLLISSLTKPIPSHNHPKFTEWRTLLTVAPYFDSPGRVNSPEEYLINISKFFGAVAEIFRTTSR